MKFNNFPYYIAITSMMLPPIAAYFDNKFFAYFPFLLIGLSFFYQLIKNKLIIVKGGLIVSMLILYSVIHGVITTLTIGHGSFGLIGLILTTVIFYQQLITNKYALDSRRLMRQLITIYIIHVVFLFIEFALRIFGYESLLLNMFGNAESVTKMKNYNSASFLWFLGFPREFFGLNGLLLGSQSAGQVMVCAFIIGVQWYKYSWINGFKGFLTTAITLVAFLIAVNMTSVLILVIICFAMIYIIPISNIRNVVIKILVPLGLVILSPVVMPIVFYRIEDYNRDTNIYLEAFGSPIDLLTQMNKIELLFGIGSVQQSVEFSDFGFAMLTIHVGIVLMMLCIITFISVLSKFYKISKAITARKLPINNDEKRWLWLGTVNALISTVFAVSLVHYTPAVELGGLQMFAFSIALLIISSKELNRRLVIKDNFLIQNVDPQIYSKST